MRKVIRVNSLGILEYPPFDSEVPVTPAYIRHLLDYSFDELRRMDEIKKDDLW